MKKYLILLIFLVITGLTLFSLLRPVAAETDWYYRWVSWLWAVDKAGDTAVSMWVASYGEKSFTTNPSILKDSIEEWAEYYYELINKVPAN